MPTNFRHLKEGDKVMRWHGSGPWMEMHVVRVRDNTLIAAPRMPTRELTDDELASLWTFDRDTGAEEDTDLQWGVKFGKTGSYLKEI